MATSGSASPIERRVAVRATISSDRAVRRHLTVHCESRCEAVDIATCSACACCLFVRVSKEGRPEAVVCRPGPSVETNRASESGPHTPVRAVMERDIVCVMSDVGIDAIVRLLSETGVEGIAVVDDSGHPVGMVSWTDLRRAAEARAPATSAAHPPEPAAVAFHVGAALADRCARDVMSPVVYSVVESTELARALALMSMTGFHQLPVVMGDGSVGGMLTLRALTRFSLQ